MIVKMKKATIVCLEKYVKIAIEKLHDVGVIHVIPVETMKTSTAHDFKLKLKQIEQVVNILSSLHLNSAEIKAVEKELVDDSVLNLEYLKYHILQIAEEIVESVLDLEQHRIKLSEKIIQLNNQIDNLEIWGNFSPKDLKNLEKNNIIIKLYLSFQKDIPEIPEGCVYHEKVKSSFM